MVINTYCGKALTRIVISLRIPLHIQSINLFEPQVSYGSFVTTVNHE